MFESVDLHTHTTASDGALSPEALVDLARNNHTELLAITDHDTIAGYLSVRDQYADIQLISGVELSTTWRGVGVHIVGLNFEVEHPAMTALLAFQAGARQQRCEKILQKLAKLNMPIETNELHQFAGHSHIGRPHIAQAMVAAGYVNSVDAAFKKYLGAGKMGDVKSGWASLPEVVAAIVDSGGVAAIAHPNYYKVTRTKLLALIDGFKAAGGQAIEVISGGQHRDISEKYAHIANEKGLLASLGSDFHRHYPHSPSVGKISALPASVTPIWTAFR